MDNLCRAEETMPTDENSFSIGIQLPPAIESKASNPRRSARKVNCPVVPKIVCKTFEETFLLSIPEH
jgi:hypothetical protein